MNRAQAHQEAHRRWGTPGTAPGDRYGIVVVRQKKVVERFEVGYAIRGGRTDGGTLLHQWVLMGKGPSWEEAFARAAGSVMITEAHAAGPAAITDDQIREVIAATLALGKGKRQNAHTRSLRRDCQGALDGSLTCREHVAEMIAEYGGREYHGVSILDAARLLGGKGAK